MNRLYVKTNKQQIKKKKRERKTKERKTKKLHIENYFELSV